MQAKKRTKFFVLIAFFILAAAACVWAGSDPSRPRSVQMHGNTTVSYPNGTLMNQSRGFIYNLTINETQTTIKWKGYVGQVNGVFALQDADARALYDWTITNITGELYATKEGPLGADPNYESTDPYAGGIPLWHNLSCAVMAMINLEQAEFNHSQGVEDSYNRTFNSNPYSNPGFYAGDRQITDTTMWNATGGENCFGINMNVNNTHNTTHWYETILTDGTFQRFSLGDATSYYDLIYAVLLENNTMGYDGTQYDFQILLPETALPGSQPNTPYYFYIELI